MIQERLAQLRAKMKEYHIDAYYIPTADYHESEYVADYFKARVYLSNFTGSAGVMVVRQEEAGLWTDGRYFVQAARQLEGTSVTLFKMGEEGVPTVEEYLEKTLSEGGCLGFDGGVVSTQFARTLEKIAAKKNASLHFEDDLVSMIWENRPAFPCAPAYVLDVKYAGESVESKLTRVRDVMRQHDCTAQVLTTLDDIVWTLNVRGDDVPCNPVVISFLVITNKDVHWFVDEKKVTAEVKAHLDENGVVVHPYDDVYGFVATLEGNVLVDPAKANYRMFKAVGAPCELTTPQVLMKAMKNEVQVENLRQSHIADGVAMTKFIYWLKKNVGTMEITEYSASEYLASLRAQQEGFIGLSFGTIAAYNANAAMMHYAPSADRPVYLNKEGFFLVDSGGQYFKGTTDITRTICLGEVPQLWKEHYTRTLRGMIGVSTAKFLYGCKGINLDILARGPLWNIGIDYKCGTGHGVGYLLNVHEAPNGFRWKVVPERNDSAILEEGMITTIEPGVYRENSHGIRIENELVCHKDEKNGDGQFMSFETITMCPIDLDPVLPEMMTRDEIAFLNCYHAKVYDTISPYLTEEEREWLKTATKSI